MNKIDHVAIVVEDLDTTVQWYLAHFKAKLIYQDKTWAMLEFANIKLAFVISNEHPAHIAFISKDAKRYGKLKRHRDDTYSCYIKDPSGNVVEIVKSE
ncbi:VOC family protein [Fastidiosibacter lacustris]|uniref:VOC family protein n=1 Tax=Fastidiosibacter lacustris TaxID=2056695 RepID=UPI000E34B374|nr:VOC family protein [Fastidiosibacter lacustris]